MLGAAFPKRERAAASGGNGDPRLGGVQGLLDAASLEAEDSDPSLPEEDSESDWGRPSVPSVWCRRAAVLQRTHIFPPGGEAKSCAERCLVHLHPHQVRERVDEGRMWVFACAPGARTNSIVEEARGCRPRGREFGSTSESVCATW